MQLGQFSIQSVEILRVIVNEGLFAKSDLLAEYTMEFSITGSGQFDQRAAAVFDLGDACYQAFFFQTIDYAGQGPFSDQGSLAQFLEAHAAGIAQRGDDVEL